MPVVDRSRLEPGRRRLASHAHPRVRASASGVRMANGSPARWSLPLGPSIAWLSMVLVTKPARGQGLGTRLLSRCLAEVEASGAAAGLDATEFGPADLSAARLPRRLSAVPLARPAGVRHPVRPPGTIVVRGARWTTSRASTLTIPHAAASNGPPSRRPAVARARTCPRGRTSGRQFCRLRARAGRIPSPAYRAGRRRG